MNQTRFEDDPIEHDLNAQSWIKWFHLMRRQDTGYQWHKSLSEQEIINEARIRAFITVIPRPIVTEPINNGQTSNQPQSPTETIEEIDLQIQLLELKLKKVKLQKKLKSIPPPPLPNPDRIETVEESSEEEIEETEASSSSSEQEESSDESIAETLSSNESFEIIPEDKNEENNAVEIIQSLSTLRYIDLEFQLEGYSEYRIRSFYDTGASLMLARYHIFPPELWIKQTPKLVSYANQSTGSIMYKAVQVPFKLGYKTYSFDFWCHDAMSHDIIVGNPFWIYLQQSFMSITGNTVHTKDNSFVFYEHKNPARETPWQSEFTHAERGGHITQVSENSETKHWKMQVEEILLDTFSDNPLALYNPRHPKCQIELLPQDQLDRLKLKCPVRCKPIGANPIDMEEFHNQINELLRLKLIRKTNSPWSFQAFMVRNHAEIVRGKARMVINYKPLNLRIRKNAYRIPNKDSLFLAIRESQFYSKFDCKSGFYQVPMEQDSIQLTAFSTPIGSYEWLVMPFGLATAPSIFQAKMDNVLEDHHDYCLVYIDDIIVFSRTLEEHKIHVITIAKTLKKNGIVISKKKMELGLTKINFLGCEIENGRIILQNHVLENLSKFPSEIKDKKELQSFLGIINYAASHYSIEVTKLRVPLQKKLKKNYIWSWTEQDKQIVEQIKTICQNLPALELPKNGDKLVLTTDASDKHWAGVLQFYRKIEQEVFEKDLRVSRYCSGTWNQTEQNWSTFGKELRAIKLALQKFKLFLFEPFTLYSDNLAVINFLKKDLNEKRSQREIRDKLDILQYQGWMTLKHIPGTKNVLADALTRGLSN
ncbi:reverse transcriptase [Rose yellow vein virus]|uniref:RNA-directed DNA polymerase n=1 Tax=Rose yellow vein virus TaxID=1213588 RepID=I7BP23_9VIRU|nr:reverse transcriptase [Rose yellow vein virus]AFO54491.1 reverse transcriptase [Rose yellow vein virus]